MTRIINDELENFRLNFSRCANRDVAPLNRMFLSMHSKMAAMTSQENQDWVYYLLQASFVYFPILDDVILKCFILLNNFYTYCEKGLFGKGNLHK